MERDLSQDFYNEEVFNFFNSDALFIDAIRNQNQVLEYKDLHNLLKNMISKF